MDRTFKKVGLEPILFADDGLIVTEEKEFKLLKLLKDSKVIEAGIILSDKRKDGEKVTRCFNKGKFTFVGLTYDLDAKTFSIGDTNFRHDMPLKDMVNLAWNNTYGKKGITNNWV